MDKLIFHFTGEIYESELNVIQGISFTQRQIDIMVSRLYEKRYIFIARLLSIESPRTVETHLRTIAQKIGSSTKERIYEFFKKAEKLEIAKLYYCSLKLQREFEDCLIQLSKDKSLKEISYQFEINKNQEESFFINQLIKHIGQLGFHITVNANQALSPTIVWKNGTETCSDSYTFDRKNDYFGSFFDFLKEIIPTEKVDEIFASFVNKKSDILALTDLDLNTIQTFLKRNQFKNLTKNLQSIYKKSRFIISTIMILGSFVLLYLYFNEPSKTIYARSDMIIPNESLLVSRKSLLDEMDKKLKAQNGIRVIAIIGQGGAGKTTLARRYGRLQDSPIIFEINAETHESLINSFQNLAYHLAKTEMENQTLKNIQDFKDTELREKKLLSFIKDKLRNNKSWILIFDNVEQFSDIQNYFPADPKSWGKGTVLISTRNQNIQNNYQIKATLNLGELRKEEKLDLFARIVDNKFNDKNSVETFLDKLPPYPLDISIAATYIKTSQISFDDYLKNLSQNQSNFSNAQEAILKDTTDYTHTRFKIISYSIRKLLQSNRDYYHYILLISLVDSQDIPLELLYGFNDRALADNFIRELKAYSLVTQESSIPSLGVVFSLHRSTQEMTLKFLQEEIKFSKEDPSIISASEAIEDYLTKANEKEDYEKMKVGINHTIVFLKHNEFLPKQIVPSLESQLGLAYFNLAQDKTAITYLERSLENLRKSSHSKNQDKKISTSYVLADVYKVIGETTRAVNLLEKTLKDAQNIYLKDHIVIGRIYGYIADAYKIAGKYDKAIESFENSLRIYKIHLPENDKIVGRVTGFLGNAYISTGNYKKAAILLEKSLVVLKKHYPEDHVNLARVYRMQGILENQVGHFENSKKLLEKSREIQTKKYYKDNLKVARTEVHLANTLVNLGLYNEAIKILEHSLSIHKEFLPDNLIEIGQTLSILGTAQRMLKNYTQAKNNLKEGLDIYIKTFGERHIETARVLISLGQMHLEEGNHDLAESLFQKAKIIFENYKHPDLFLVFENLSDLYENKIKQAKELGSVEKVSKFQAQSQQYLTDALEILQDHFPEDSSHVYRIKNKFEKIGPVN